MEISKLIEEINTIKNEIVKVEAEIEKVGLSEFEKKHEEIKELIEDLDRILSLFSYNVARVRIDLDPGRGVRVVLPFDRLVSVELTIDENTQISQLFDILKKSIIKEYTYNIIRITSILRDTAVLISSKLYMIESITSKIENVKNKVYDLEEEVEKLKTAEEEYN